MVVVSAGLSQDEVLCLAQRYKDGDDSAGWQLVQSQMGVIQKVAREFVSDIDDLASELTIIVYSSLKKFDPSKARLSTFVWTIAHRRAQNLMRKPIRPDHEDVAIAEPIAPTNKIEELYADLQEAADVVGLTQLEIDLLVALAKGVTKEKLCRRFKTEYRKKFWGTSMGEMFGVLSTIRDSAVARLRDSMGVEITDVTLSPGDLEQIVCQLAHRPDTSSTLIRRALRSRGIDVSLLAVQKILRQNKLSTKAERLAASVSE